jgi:hypothetical protein
MQTPIKYFKYVVLLISVLTFSQCDDDDNDDMQDDPRIVMDAPVSYGHAQYKMSVESGYDVSVPLTISTTKSLSQLWVTKTVNLQVDPSFGDNGIMTILSSPSGPTYEYTFSYSPTTGDVDKLVGFTFTAETDEGKRSESDLTLAVTLSPRDNLTRRRWNLKSVLHVNNPDHPNLESINDCEKDNAMLLYEDHTMEIDYGTDTGAGNCLFDGFNVYDSWRLAEEDKYFIRVSHGIFSPNVMVTDTFEVKTLTIDRFGIEQKVDMSALGGAADEKYLYIYQAGPK